MTNHQHTQQRELAQIITDADVDFFGGVPNPEPTGRALAAAASAITAGYRKPHTVTSAEELDGLPKGSVVMDGTGDGVVYQKRHRAEDGVQWYEPGYALNWDSLEITLPATVLYMPEVSE